MIYIYKFISNTPFAQYSTYSIYIS